MGTRMNILIRSRNDEPDIWIYRHWDGYPQIEKSFNTETQDWETLAEPELSDVGFDLSRLYTMMTQNKNYSGDISPISPKKLAAWIMYMGCEEQILQRNEQGDGEIVEVVLSREKSFKVSKPIDLVRGSCFTKPGQYEYTNAQHGDIEWLYIIEYGGENTLIPSVRGKVCKPFSTFQSDFVWHAQELTSE